MYPKSPGSVEGLEYFGLVILKEPLLVKLLDLLNRCVRLPDHNHGDVPFDIDHIIQLDLNEGRNGVGSDGDTLRIFDELVVMLFSDYVSAVETILQILTSKLQYFCLNLLKCFDFTRLG